MKNPCFSVTKSLELLNDSVVVGPTTLGLAEDASKGTSMAKLPH